MTVRFTDNEEEITNYSQLNHYFLESEQSKTKQSIDYDIRPGLTKLNSNSTSFSNKFETQCEYEESVKYGTQVVDDDVSHSSYEHLEQFKLQKVYSELTKCIDSQCRANRQKNKGEISQEQIKNSSLDKQFLSSSTVNSSIWTSILRLFTWAYRNSF